VTSYKNLYWDAISAERRNFLNPHKRKQASFLEQSLKRESGVFIAASDYLKALPASIARWLPGPAVLLGTDGYGRSETRTALRDFFEVDARHIAFAALSALAGQKRLKASVVNAARKKLEIDPSKRNPLDA
jgi:pyruvate dehydrogenase E1 component